MSVIGIVLGVLAVGGAAVVVAQAAKPAKRRKPPGDAGKLPQGAALLKDGKRVWALGGKWSEIQELTIDTGVKAEIGKAYSVTGCVETSHYMGKASRFDWPAKLTFNFIEPFSLWLRLTESGSEELGALPHSSCTYLVVPDDGIDGAMTRWKSQARSPFPVGDNAMRFPERVHHPGGIGGQPHAAQFTRPNVIVNYAGGTLKIIVRAAPLPEWNDNDGDFRALSPKDDVVVWWRVVGKEPERPGGAPGGGGQAGG